MMAVTVDLQGVLTMCTHVGFDRGWPLWPIGQSNVTSTPQGHYKVNVS